MYFGLGADMKCDMNALSSKALWDNVNILSFTIKVNSHIKQDIVCMAQQTPQNIYYLHLEMSHAPGSLLSMPCNPNSKCLFP